MINYDHIQFDPSVNRVRAPRGVAGPASPQRTSHNVPQPPADPADPYRNTHLGWFEASVKDERGKDRPYGFYIPATMKTSGSMMIVLIPGGEVPVEFFRRGGWKESLERHCMTAYFVSAPDGWDLEDPGYEVDTAVRVFAEMRSMEYFPANAPSVYALGFGDGANISVILTVLYQSYFAAFAACGDTEVDSALLDRIGSAASDCDPAVSRSEVTKPAYIVGPYTNAVDYFRKACRTGERYLSNGFARVYQEEPGLRSSFVNDDGRAEVWHSTYEQADQLGFETLVEKMVAFVAGYQFWGTYGNGDTRRTVTAENNPDLIRTDAVIDGFRRFWYTFEPSAYKRKVKDSYPLVIAIHGFSCSGEFYMQNSCWHRIAEDREFFVVYPTAYPFTDTPGGTQSAIRTGIATPHWNAHGYDGTLDTDGQGPDDVNFFRQMLDMVLEKYPEIDPERVYVSGHSNGGMMTQRLMRMMPERFAGFAPVGAMECRTAMLPAPGDGIVRNVWYTIGEHDGAGCSLEGDNGNTRTLRMICEADGLDYESARAYDSGYYHHVIIRDSANVPLVRFTGVRNWPHTVTPDVCYMIYDQFFSRFVRHKDGTLEYLA